MAARWVFEAAGRAVESAGRVSEKAGRALKGRDGKGNEIDENKANWGIFMLPT